MRVAAALTLVLAIVGFPERGAIATRIASEDAYPLEVGLRWTYRALGGVTVTREVVGLREISEREYFEMRFALPLLGPRVLPMRRTSDGVVTASGGREILLMRFPMVAGDRWTIDVPGQPETAECTVEGEEIIEALGGRRRATKLRVVRRDRRTGRESADAEWYVRGIGLAKMEVTYGVRATFVLERFDQGSRP